MTKAKLHTTIVMILLMVYIPINNMLHVVLCDYAQEILLLDDIERVTDHESHHDCADFMFKLSSFTYTYEFSLEEITSLIFSKNFGKKTTLFIHPKIINTLRGPPQKL